MSTEIITCPSCSTTLRPKVPVAPGTRIKCPKCLTIFAVPGAEAEEPEDIPETSQERDDEAATDDPVDDEPEEDRPLRRKKKKAIKKKGVPLWVWLTTGAGVLLFLCCGGCGIVFMFMPKVGIQTGAPSASVSMANFDKIKKGMTEAQVKDIMGAPTAVVTLGATKAYSWNQASDTITVTFSNDQAMDRTCQIGNVTKHGF
jgi:SmpA/OmlA family protein